MAMVVSGETRECCALSLSSMSGLPSTKARPEAVSPSPGTVCRKLSPSPQRRSYAHVRGGRRRRGRATKKECDAGPNPPNLHP
jgi:hypothetical protein